MRLIGEQRRMIDVMANLQIITHQGRLSAVVVAGQAIIDDTLAPDQQRHVQAMCLYALEVSDRVRPGPYTDPAADAYATQILNHR